MIQDIFVPSNIGSYYIFSKRVLGFEITTSSVQACLLYFAKNKVILENSMTVALQDQSPTAIINAIKKIVTTIGKYDEVVTSLTSSAVIFKELTLPFIGREKIAMIVNYEVEPLLPFPLDEAVIDFLVTEENKEKVQTTILVAAIRKIDLQAFLSHFEKAGVQVATVTLDMFALYDFYRHTMYVSQAHTSLLLVDFGIDAVRILYIHKGILRSVRLIPFGLKFMMNKTELAAQTLSDKSLESVFEQEFHEQSEQQNHYIAQQVIAEFCKQLTLSLSFFQKQIKNFHVPARIICLGEGTQLPGFVDQATEICKIPFEIIDIKRIALRNHIQSYKKIKLDAQHCASLIISLSTAHYGDVNFLVEQQGAFRNNLLNKQLFITLLMSLGIFIGFYFYSSYQLTKWNIAYNKSKKEMVLALQEQMDIDVKNIKRVTEIVQVAQSKLQQTKKVCFSFSQSNQGFLHYLEELCTKIDRQGVGLNLKKLSFHDKEIILQGQITEGSMKGIDPYLHLDTFIEELMELKNFTLKDIPRELSFNVVLQLKEEQEHK